jgi:hypothetical protein
MMTESLMSVVFQNPVFTNPDGIDIKSLQPLKFESLLFQTMKLRLENVVDRSRIPADWLDLKDETDVLWRWIAEWAAHNSPENFMRVTSFIEREGADPAMPHKEKSDSIICNAVKQIRGHLVTPHFLEIIQSRSLLEPDENMFWAYEFCEDSKIKWCLWTMTDYVMYDIEMSVDRRARYELNIQSRIDAVRARMSARAVGLVRPKELSECVYPVDDLAQTVRYLLNLKDEGLKSAPNEAKPIASMLDAKLDKKLTDSDFKSAAAPPPDSKSAGAASDSKSTIKVSADDGVSNLVCPPGGLGVVTQPKSGGLDAMTAACKWIEKWLESNTPEDLMRVSADLQWNEFKLQISFVKSADVGSAGAAAALRLTSDPPVMKVTPNTFLRDTIKKGVAANSITAECLAAVQSHSLLGCPDDGSFAYESSADPHIRWCLCMMTSHLLYDAELSARSKYFAERRLTGPLLTRVDHLRRLLCARSSGIKPDEITDGGGPHHQLLQIVQYLLARVAKH